MNSVIKKGVVEKCEVEFNNESDEFEIYFYQTSLKKILTIPFIDKSNVYSLDPFENALIFGIEAGKKSLYNEIIKVLSFDGAEIHKVYVHLICDFLTRNGIIVSINSENISISENGIMCNMFFERTVKKMINHSLYSLEDNTKSLDASLFTGKIARVGTGFFDLYTK
jgi:hypothetical protein